MLTFLKSFKKSVKQKKYNVEKDDFEILILKNFILNNDLIFRKNKKIKKRKKRKIQKKRRR